MAVTLQRVHRYMEEWLRDSTSEERLGLRMIWAIVEHQGDRKFKRKPANFYSTRAGLSSRRTSSSDVAAQFSRAMYRTSYGAQFGGDVEKAPTELQLLREKKFSETPMAEILTSEAKDCIDKWLAIETDEDYKNIVLGMIRSYFTRCKNHEFTRSSCQEGFSPPKQAMMAKAPRFDKLRTAIEMQTKKEALKAKTLKNLGVYQSSTRSAYRSIRGTSSSRMTNRSVGASASNIIGPPKDLKARFLKGNGKITDSLANIPGRALPSLYQESFKGHLVKDKVMRRTDQDFFCRSFSGPHVSPDPPTIYYDREKISRFTNDLTVFRSDGSSSVALPADTTFLPRIRP